MKILLDIGLGTTWSRWRYEIGSRGRPVLSIRPETGQTFKGQVRLQESFRLAGCCKERFRGQITASDRAFHGGRPPGTSPIASQKKILYGTNLRRAPAIHAGRGRKCRVDFLDHGSLAQLRVASGRQNIGEIATADIDNFLARLLYKVIRRADYKLEILAVRIRAEKLFALRDWTRARAVGFRGSV